MGYTHYWKFKKIKGNARATAKQYQRAIDACATLVRSYYIANGGLQGYSAHCKPKQYGGINFNGAREDAHETFVLREHFADYFRNGASAFDFCKTAGKPYDTVAVACLCILKHYLGDAVHVSSDGDSSDWIAGLELARRSTKQKIALPQGIETRMRAI